MTPKLATVVGRKGVARGLMIGRTRLKAEWRAALSYIGSVVRMYVD
jgi:hypothetical protein